MNWKLTIIVLTLLIPLASAEIITLDGGACDSNSCLLILRNPFYEVTTYSCVVVVDIFSPVEGATYYENNILLNFTVAGADVCYYSSGGG